MMACIFSKDRKYRFTLTRQVSIYGVGTVAFVMLNPSTADDVENDPTIRRCLGFARSIGPNGFRELAVVNLYAWRSSFPSDLLKVPDPIGPHNDEIIVATCTQAQLVICAWGSFAFAKDRGSQVLALLRQNGVVPHALKMTQSQQPAHPSRLPGTLRPFPIPER